MRSGLTEVIDVRWFLVLALLLLCFAEVYAQGEEIFAQKCSGCHSVGGGDLAGPDLEGVTERRDTEWLIREITEPEKLLEERDPAKLELVERYGMRMPNLGISRDEAILIIEYLGGGSAEAGGAEVVATGDPELGRRLFTGDERFQNGGAPCIACHSVSRAGISGGSIAADLGDAYSRIGAKGLAGALKGMQFPVMKDAYAEKKLTDDEIAALVAFLEQASESRERAGTMYPISGIAVFVVLLLIAAVYYRRVE
jgi:mono/diheme cytochrome c family protein